MNMFGEALKIRFLFAIAILWFVSMVMSCQEIRFMSSGVTTDATFVGKNVEKRRGKYGREYFKHVAEVTYLDGSQFQRAFLQVSEDWVGPEEANATIKIDYLPGREYTARFHGQRNYFWLTIFFGSLTILIVGGGLYIYAHRER